MCHVCTTITNGITNGMAASECVGTYNATRYVMHITLESYLLLVIYTIKNFVKQDKKKTTKMGDFLGVFVNNEIVAFVRFDTSLEFESVNKGCYSTFDSQATFDECLELVSRCFPRLEEVFWATAKMRVFSQIEKVARVVFVDQKTERLLWCLENTKAHTTHDTVCIHASLRSS